MTNQSQRILIRPYAMNSKSAKLLKGALGCQFIKKENSQYAPRDGDLVINWGCSYMPNYHPARILNNGNAVSTACCKARTFRQLSVGNVPTVDWTVDRSKAFEWIRQGYTVAVRHTTTGSGGKGIEIYTPSRSASEAPPAAGNSQATPTHTGWFSWLVGPSTAQQTPIYLPLAPLYTKFIKKEAEFRVHAAGGKAIHTQMKLRKEGIQPQEIWNHDNGYVFTSQLEGRIDPSILHSVREVGVRAIQALDLDFGAADLAYSSAGVQVLEVNTAPGIEEPTLSQYVKYIRGINV